MEPHIPSWLLNSLIYLSAAVVMVPLSQALGLGSIIGYLAAGIAIGPWGLGLVTNVADILHFAEFGVVLMLFLIGLELEPKRLWSLRRPIFGWGTAQVAGCALVIFGGAYALGASWQVALAASLGLALSSTAIAMQVMQERNLLGTRSGEAGFSILLFQDVAAIPILALIPALGSMSAAYQDPDLTHSWFDVIKPIAAIAGVILGGRLLLRPVLRWIARSHSTEIFTAAALLLVVGIAALMQVIGLSMALGAFLAGVLLAESEYRRELETDIAPFKGLLLGLFFMAVGMSVDFGVLLRSPGMTALILIGFLIAKLLVIYALAKAMKLPFQERPVFTLLLAQGGEFSFVVFQAATNAGVFSAELNSQLVAAVALSMLFTPLLLVAVDKLLLNKLAQRGSGKKLDEIAEPQEAPIIIAGFGRYGQIVGRTLLAQGIQCTVLDHNADTVEAIRSFGYRVFYGDATRLDLLRMSGAESAKVLVVAVDDVAQSLQIVDVAREHFPHLKIIARARDVPHWGDLRDRGVEFVERELFESSLRSARSVLEALGQSPHAARQHAMRFRRHNLALFEQLYPHRNDRAQTMAVAKRGRQQLEEQMAQERALAAELRAARSERWDQ